ncbi:MAG: cytochrome c maturation protein CcmE [Acidimicrobiia bacterium]
MDLTPRDPGPGEDDDGEGKKRKKRNYPAIALLAVAIIGVAVVLFFGLNNATSYYCNADEVGVKSGCSGTSRFRLQGQVVPGSVEEAANTVDFVVQFNGVKVPVHHSGEPADLFKECIGVVMVGSLNGDVFDSDEMIIKHSEKYEKANPDRVANDTTCGTEKTS